MSKRFYEKLLGAARKNQSWLCIGLDPDINKIPNDFGSGSEAILKFNKAIIDSTSDLVCAYKPNSAFYEALGPEGMRILFETIKLVPEHIAVILDFKRGDIGNTAAMYAKSAFEYFRADAVTVSPYLGKDSIEPFINYKDKGVFILCLTSNPSSADIQKQFLIKDSLSPTKKMNVFIHVARLSMEWNVNGNIGLVAGATSPAELQNIRKEIGGQMPLLIPGVGSQGGDLERAVVSGSNSSGEMAVVNISRGIIYAGEGGSFTTSIRQKTKYYKDAIHDFLMD